MSTQIAAQMYTLRDHCETPSDIAKSCAKLKEIGFSAIQASASGFNTIEADEFKKILDDHGMACCATHRGVDALAEAEKTIAYHQAIGCGLTAIGGFGFGGKSKEEWKAWAESFNQIAQQYRGSGVKVGYHNHSHELAPFGLSDHPESISPTDTPYDLMESVFGDDVWWEVDTYWIAHGGGDPAAWIRRFKGNIPAIHVKDMTISPSREHKMCEVGAGNLNWPAILDAAREAGVHWYIIERDNGDLDPFESLKISLNNLRSWGLA